MTGLPVWPAFVTSDEQALLIDGDPRAGALPDASELDSIGRVYPAASLVANHAQVLGAAACALLVAALYAGWRVVRRRLRCGARAA